MSHVKPATYSQKIGKSGELAVAGILFKHVDNVYLPLVDYGVDLIALVNNKFRKIQVKTGKVKKDNGYWITFYKYALDNIKGPDAFFIFVLEDDAEYLVVPSTDLSDQIARGDIKVDKNDCCHLYFYKEGNSVAHWPTNNTSVDFSKYMDNWPLLI